MWTGLGVRDVARCLPRHKRGALGTDLSAPACARGHWGHLWSRLARKGGLEHPCPPKKRGTGTPPPTQKRDTGDTSVHLYPRKGHGDTSVYLYPNKGHLCPPLPNKGHLCPSLPKKGTLGHLCPSHTQTRDTGTSLTTQTRDTGDTSVHLYPNKGHLCPSLPKQGTPLSIPTQKGTQGHLCRPCLCIGTLGPLSPGAVLQCRQQRQPCPLIKSRE